MPNSGSRAPRTRTRCSWTVPRSTHAMRACCAKTRRCTTSPHCRRPCPGPRSPHGSRTSRRRRPRRCGTKPASPSPRTRWRASSATARWPRSRTSSRPATAWRCAGRRCAPSRPRCGCSAARARPTSTASRRAPCSLAIHWSSCTRAPMAGGGSWSARATPHGWRPRPSPRATAPPCSPMRRARPTAWSPAPSRAPCSPARNRAYPNCSWTWAPASRWRRPRPMRRSMASIRTRHGSSTCRCVMPMGGSASHPR